MRNASSIWIFLYNQMDMINAKPQAPHLPVLYHEIITALHPTSPGKYLDATIGAGGHARGILEASSPRGELLGMDLDKQALAIADQRLKHYNGRYTLVQSSYTRLLDAMQDIGWEEVNGIIIDLGLSSMQLDTPERGFSFRLEGPLDMRFDPERGLSAADLINQSSEKDLADIIWRYGEEKQSRRIARAIIAARPVNTTSRLAEIIAGAIKGQRGKTHPATRTFQALRIAVNQELQAVEAFLPLAVAALAPGGRLAVISFHSLEDRIVKQYFAQESKDCLCPPEQPVCTCDHKAILERITKRPIVADETEIIENPRARSARLRIAAKKMA
jgi:16S rRNA (cytosine1402-N4)-methyltransferase